MHCTETGSTSAVPATDRSDRWTDRRTTGAVVVVLVLIALSFLNDPGGYLGTDTGGKTATLEAMTRRGDWSLDVGYWAEKHDPDGTFHPLYGTQRTDEGWVQVTSVPMILAARPLWELGGYRAALLLPILGTVGAALAAAALAERLGSRRDGTRAFWLFGLGSPLVVYGLDLWEHSIGVAFVGWASVVLFDVVTQPRRRSLIRAVGGGALLAFAATMRTDSLVYAVALVAAGSTATVLRRRPGDAVALGAAALAGFAPVWLANSVVEAAVGGNSRAERASGVVSGAGDELGIRFEEGLRTTFALSATDSWAPVLAGVVLTILAATAVSRGARLPQPRLRLLLALLLSLSVLTMLSGLGFVPGLFAAFPIAAAALAVDRVAAQGRVIVGIAVVSLPVVWAFQYIGGAGPQWAGRYVLASTFLLGVVGVVAVGSAAVPRSVAATLVGMSVAVTAFGVVWLHERSHDVDRFFDRLVEVQDEALVARNPFFLREGGPVALDQRWLSAEDPNDLVAPVEVLRRSRIERFSVLQREGYPPPDVEGARVTGTDRIPTLGVVFEVIHLRFER